MADHIVLLGNADIIGIPRTIRAYDQMHEGACTLRDTVKVHIWLNKVRAEATGRDAERELANTWQRFGPRNPISGFLPYDRKTVDRGMVSWADSSGVCAQKPAYCWDSQAIHIVGP